MSDIMTTNSPDAIAQVPVTEKKNTSLIERLANRLNVDSKKLWATMVQTCFKPDRNGNAFTNEEIMYVMMIAEQLDLNPLRREIWAFRGNGGVQPIVSIDGWKSIMLRQPSFNGYEVRYSDTTVDLGKIGKVPEWCECTIWLKGIDHPTTERVYTNEVFMSNSPVWCKSPRRMLHHRAMIQAIRFSFPITGISDVGVAADGSVIDADDIVNESYSNSGVGVPRRLSTSPSHVAFAQDQLDQVANKVIAMARKCKNYEPAFKFAETLETTSRTYVVEKIQAARDEDLRKAIETQGQSLEDGVEAQKPINNPAQTAEENMPSTPSFDEF